MGWKPTSPARAVYEDVSEKAWYAGALETAYHQGAITSQDGSFRPLEPITRAEIVSILNNMIQVLVQETELFQRCQRYADD